MPIIKYVVVETRIKLNGDINDIMISNVKVVKIGHVNDKFDEVVSHAYLLKNDVSDAILIAGDDVALIDIIIVC